MTPCPAHLGGYPDGLRCTETGDHRTHRFESSAVSDGHDESESRAEASRG